LLYLLSLMQLNSFEVYVLRHAPCPLRSFVCRANFFMDDTRVLNN
jgi:hypothetical protein